MVSHAACQLRHASCASCGYGASDRFGHNPVECARCERSVEGRRPVRRAPGRVWRWRL